MKILDLDLDIFVRPLKGFCQETTERAESTRYKPMPQSEIIQALNERMRLNANSPIKGSLVETHKEIYFIWRDMIKRGELQTPFDLVHIDGHADLGMGDSSYIYIQEEWILEDDKFKDPKIGGWTGLGSGNYLAFAIANGWISSLTYVSHEDNPDDVNHMFFKDWKVESGIIEIKKVEKGDFHTACMRMRNDEIRYDVILSIPFSRVPLAEYHANERFDYAFAAKSPAYTPIELDFVNSMIEERIDTRKGTVTDEVHR
jgi:hypothetical protein